MNQYQKATLEVIARDLPKNLRPSQVDEWFRDRAADDSLPEHIREVAGMHADGLKRKREKYDSRNRARNKRLVRLRAECEIGVDPRLTQGALNLIWNEAQDRADSSSADQIKEAHDEIHGFVTRILDEMGIDR